MSGRAVIPRAAVAVTVLRQRSGLPLQFLLVQRARPPRQGSWSIPGGKIELGESSIKAAARELEEETGLSADNDVRFHPWSIACSDVIVKNGDGLGWNFHYVITQFLAFAPPAAIPVSGDDASAVRWATLAEVESGSIELGGNVSPIFRRAMHLVESRLVTVEDAIIVTKGSEVPEYLVEH